MNPINLNNENNGLLDAARMRDLINSRSYSLLKELLDKVDFDTRKDAFINYLSANKNEFFKSESAMRELCMDECWIHLSLKDSKGFADLLSITSDLGEDEQCSRDDLIRNRIELAEKFSNKRYSNEFRDACSLTMLKDPDYIDYMMRNDFQTMTDCIKKFSSEEPDIFNGIFNTYLSKYNAKFLRLGALRQGLWLDNNNIYKVKIEFKTLFSSLLAHEEFNKNFDLLGKFMETHPKKVVDLLLHNKDHISEPNIGASLNLAQAAVKYFDSKLIADEDIRAEAFVRAFFAMLFLLGAFLWLGLRGAFDVGDIVGPSVLGCIGLYILRAAIRIRFSCYAPIDYGDEPTEIFARDQSYNLDRKRKLTTLIASLDARAKSKSEAAKSVTIDVLDDKPKNNPPIIFRQDVELGLPAPPAPPAQEDQEDNGAGVGLNNLPRARLN